MKRKTFLYALGAATASRLITKCETPHLKHIHRYDGKRLIIIRLDGGNDGLYALAPKHNESLKKLRPTLLKNTIVDGINLEKNWMLHPSLSAISDLWNKEQAVFKPFVGFNKINTSHFKSAELWESGLFADDVNPDKTGWVGRLVEESKSDTDLFKHYPVLKLHNRQTIIDKTPKLAAFSWLEENPLNTFYDTEEWLSKKSANKLKNRVQNEVDQLNLFKEIRPVPNYPKTQLGLQLSKAASVIKHDLPYQYIHANLGGFDTHLSQPLRLNSLYDELNQALLFFNSSITQSQWMNTMIMIYSEFGRTVDENKNHGTDHGYSGLSLILSGDESYLKQIKNLKDFSEYSFTNYTPILNTNKDLIKHCSDWMSMT